MHPTLLIQGDDARRELAHQARDVLANAVREMGGGDPLSRVLDALTPQLGILTLARVADLLGVTQRTVAETYVAKLGLPAHRVSKTASPWFVLDEVVAWVRRRNERADSAGRHGDANRSSFISQDELRRLMAKKLAAMKARESSMTN